MRDTTRIRANAEEALAELKKLAPDNGSLTNEELEQVTSNLQEIIRTATKMDARTGTIDPNERKNAK